MRWEPPPNGAESWAVWLASQSEAVRSEFVASLTEHEQFQLEYDWGFWAREKQLEPPGDWRTWLLLAGRGFGKTRTGAEWVIKVAQEGRPQRNGIALVAPTVDDARDVIVQGESGILAHSPPWFKPQWEPSKRLLVWPNGEWARTYSADKPDRLRGKQHAFAWADELAAWRFPYAWADELAAWRFPDAWDQLMLGLRLGPDPRVVVTTTPRPTDIIRELAKASTTFLTEGTTYENTRNLARAFTEAIIRKYEGTRLGLQELYARILDDNPNALWKRAWIERDRILPGIDLPLGSTFDDWKRAWARKHCKRICVAIDPAATSGEGSAETGIIVVGLREDGHGVVLDDASDRMHPAEWARRAVWKYHEWEADFVVGEVNNGGEMVEHTLRSAKDGGRVPYKAVHASRGKRTRAEPIAAFAEQGRVHHLGVFPKLEDQLCDWDPSGDGPSPDRLDAKVWGLSALMLTDGAPDRGDIPAALAVMLG